MYIHFVLNSPLKHIGGVMLASSPLMW